MLVVLIVQWGLNVRRSERLTELLASQAAHNTAQLVELNVDCVGTLKDLSDNLEALRDSGVNMSSRLREELDRTRDHISEKVDRLAEKIQNGK